MPINIYDIIEQARQTPMPAYFFWLIPFFTVSMVGSVVSALRSKDRLAIIFFCIFASTSIGLISGFMVNGAEIQLAKEQTIANQVKQLYGLDLNRANSDKVLGRRDLPIQLSDGERILTLDVLDDGTVVVRDSDGRLVKPAQ